MITSSRHVAVRPTVLVGLLLGFVCFGSLVGASATETVDSESSGLFAGIELRNIGPALMSGRIADIAIHPTRHSTWYVAVGSGGVWKTENRGTTWVPLFDEQSSYSVGCVTLDPSNPNVVWVGTGENVGGRHVGFGDGVYRSRDAGASWEHMGLADSQHISRIVVDPNDSNIVFVASQGPLWSPGGDRGLYRTEDGGLNWTKVLGGNEWTGVTDIVMDPRSSATLYAATWQHHRTVAALMDGGPESGLYKSTDGGLIWRRLEHGLPKQTMGKIGLAICPHNPDTVYAAIELTRRTGGIWRSADRGESWETRSDAVSGATGPHYYQELVASPHAEGRIYLLDVRVQVSDDGGATFRRLKEQDKHSDNHALAFVDGEPGYLLAGTDGGLYESWDDAASWRFVANLPVTQFYKVAVDDSSPFYWIYGGTQDNSTQGGPSRTDNVNGIQNSDWIITVFADGHQPAVEPGNPDIVYCEWQQGNLVRHDRTTGEIVYIKPQPEPGDPPERFNWDSPILVSPHQPTRLYFASQRVWRSDNRGDSWRPVSGDLTRDQDRMILPLMERVWSYDEPWDLDAMSNFNTITSLAESPVEEGLVYAGTDDGLIQVRDPASGDWQAIEVGSLPDVPERAFVNDIKADLFDADTVYIALDNHKEGDFKPYLYASRDRGLTWRSIAGDLPDRHLVWRLVQDHVDPGLMFAGTEMGLYVTRNGGGSWVKLDGGVPTIPFRDLAIQRRENDLVGATFGRGFFIFDDYSFLRESTDEALDDEAHLFPVRDAWWYIPRRPLGEDGKASLGAAHYIAPNPPFGAVITYHLARPLQSREAARREREKDIAKEGGDTPYPGWDALEAERREEAPAILVTIRDDAGEVVRRLEGPATEGFHRIAWDLRRPRALPVTDEKANEWNRPQHGWLVPPGTYTAELAKRANGEVTELTDPVAFKVTRLRNGALEGSPPEDTAAFLARFDRLAHAAEAAKVSIASAFERLQKLKTALAQSTADPAGKLDGEVRRLEQRLYVLDEALRGNQSQRGIGEPATHTILDRLRFIRTGNQYSTYGPTPSQRHSLEIARSEFSVLREDLHEIFGVDLPALEQRLEAAGVPWTPGRPLPEAPSADESSG